MHPKFRIEREKNNSLFYKEYKNDRCVFQFHSQIELYFVTEGEMEMNVSGHTDTVRAGELSVALSYEPHAYKTPLSSRSCVLIIPTEICEAFIAAVMGKRLISPFFKDTETVNKMREYAVKTQDMNLSAVSRLGYVHLILGSLLEKASFTDSSSPESDDLAGRILMYIEENFVSGCSPSDIAKHFGYTQSYISRYFKSCFGINLSEYVTLVRLKRAAALLQGGKHSITYAALESGFNSMRTFYRAFVREFECTPKQYLKGNSGSVF